MAIDSDIDGRDDVVCVFSKAPVPGRVKTRLAVAVGDDVACALARAFIADTVAAIRHATPATIVLVLDGEPALLPPLATDILVWPQGGGHLGARQERALQRALERSGRVLAVGTDAPTFPAELLHAAFAALLHHDAVLTPAADGGYCLLGLRRCLPGLLDGIAWSAPDTAARTIERLQAQGLSVACTASWYDVDTVDDLHRLRDELSGPDRAGVHLAPHTMRVLDAAFDAAVSRS